MDLPEAVIATLAVMGQEMPDVGLRALLAELRQHPERDVLLALTRCRKELRKLTLADILDRLPNGHPGVEEAWAIVSKTLNDEAVSIVWTGEMAEAFGEARALGDDPVAARLAFKEVYSRLIQEARAMNAKPSWRASLGHDPRGRESAIQEAVAKGRLTQAHAARLLPDLSEPRNKNLVLPAMRGFDA